jgi:hypothetical protein
MDSLGIDGRIIFQFIKKKQVLKTWIGFIWLRILTTVRDVCVAVMYCRFYKMQRTFSVVDAHLAPEDGLFFVLLFF